MANFLKVFALISFSLSLCLGENDLPSYFPRCHIDDPELEKCFITAAETLRPHIRKGIPELNIPPMDPIVIPEVKMEQGTNALNYKLTLINATVKGFGDYVFKKLLFDPQTLIFNGLASFNELTIDANYEMNGKILLAPIAGKGTAFLVMGPSTGSLIAKGELVKKGNEEYLKIVDIKAVVKVSNGTSHLDGLFNGNKELEEAANRLINDHAPELFEEMRPAVEEVALSIFRVILDNLYSKVPFKKLLPPSH